MAPSQQQIMTGTGERLGRQVASWSLGKYQKVNLCRTGCLVLVPIDVRLPLDQGHRPLSALSGTPCSWSNHKNLPFMPSKAL